MLRYACARRREQFAHAFDAMTFNRMFQEFGRPSEKGGGEWNVFNVVRDGSESRVTVSTRHIVGANPHVRLRREPQPFELRRAW